MNEASFVQKELQLVSEEKFETSSVSSVSLSKQPSAIYSSSEIEERTEQALSIDKSSFGRKYSVSLNAYLEDDIQRDDDVEDSGQQDDDVEDSGQQDHDVGVYTDHDIDIFFRCYNSISGEP